MSGHLVLNKLRQPYGYQTSISRRWQTCVLFSVFVFLFLLFFRPFDIGSSPLGIIPVCLAYGLTTFMIMALLNIAVPALFPRFFNEESWTVGKEISWSMVNILLIGLGNALFNSYAGHAPLSLLNILLIEFYTLAVGVFPVTVSVLLKENRLRKKYGQQSEQINTELKEHHEAVTGQDRTEFPEYALICIPSENAGEDLELLASDLLYIQSSDNYIEVYYKERNVLSKKLLRNSLKAVTESLVEHPQLFRCHKSYLVNLLNVVHVSGNAQGYKLHLLNTDFRVPVSRQHNEEIKKRLAGTP